MIVRKMTEKDINYISELMRNQMEFEYNTIQFKPRWLREKIKYKKDMFLVAVDEKPIGVIRICLLDNDLAEIRNFLVDENHRKKGVGKQLMENALKSLRKNNTRKVITKIRSDNKISLKVFKKFKFKKEGYFKDHFKEGIDIVQLYKFLK